MTTTTRTPLLVGLIAATILFLIPGSAHAATGSFRDKHGDMPKGAGGDIIQVTYRAGWYWNSFALTYGTNRPTSSDLRIDTRPAHPGAEFVATMDDKHHPHALRIVRASGTGTAVCDNKRTRWHPTAHTTVAKFGLGCLRGPGGHLPTKLRVRAVSEVDHHTPQGEDFDLDFAPGPFAWSPWIKVAPHP